MQVVILAAGTGSRLKDKTTSIPKALIPVAGRPLLAYSLKFAQMAGGEEIIVVVGCFADKVVALLKELNLPGVHWVENKDYLLGNLYSLGAARGEISADFLMMNTDHIYRRGIADLVREQCSGLTAFCDQDRTLGADDMKVALAADGRLSEISKKLTEFQRGYVGMTFCGRDRQKEYFEAFDRVAERHGDQAVVEMVLGELASHESPPGVGDISGVGWLEVDTPEELEQAERAIQGAPGEYSAAGF